MSALYIQVPIILDLSIEANNIRPDQTALRQSDLGSYCLQYSLS